MGTPVSGDNTTVAVIIRKLRTCDVWDRAIQVCAGVRGMSTVQRGECMWHTSR